MNLIWKRRKRRNLYFHSLPLMQALMDFIWFQTCIPHASRCLYIGEIYRCVNYSEMIKSDDHHSDFNFPLKWPCKINANHRLLFTKCCNFKVKPLATGTLTTKAMTIINHPICNSEVNAAFTFMFQMLMLVNFSVIHIIPDINIGLGSTGI